MEIDTFSSLREGDIGSKKLEMNLCQLTFMPNDLYAKRLYAKLPTTATPKNLLTNSSNSTMLPFGITL